MVTLDTSTLVLVVLAAGLIGALAAVMPLWPAMRGGRALPVWTFLRRRGTALERVGALQAELRCETCNAKLRCKQALAGGADTPPGECPNGALFR
jgi:hypothetical protein